MTDMMLYSQPVPERAQTRAENTVRRQLALKSALGGDGSVVDLGGDPNERRVRVQYRGYGSERLAREVDALFASPEFGEVAYYGVAADGSHDPTQEDGYYALEGTDSGAEDPRLDGLPYASGRLREVGTRKSHWREVSTAPYQPANTNPFGNTLEAHIAVPASCSRARWYSRDPPGVEDATPIATRTGEWGDVEIYDAESSTWDDPSLICDHPYGDEATFDPVVWDTHGKARSGTVDGETVVEWEHVLRTGREFAGEAVLSNGLVRCFLDDGAGTLSVEEWDTSLTTPAWSSVALGSTTAADSWSLLDLDLRGITQQSVTGYTTWTDGSAEYDLRVTLDAGFSMPLWTIPGHEADPLPVGLEDKLSPVAYDTAYLPMAGKTAAERSEVTA